MTDDNPDYELLMPFVVCQSQGGPYEDQAFVAGYEMGQLDLELGMQAVLGVSSIGRTLRQDSLPQIELIAMKRGYTVRAGCDYEGGWVDVDFTLEEQP